MTAPTLLLDVDGVLNVFHDSWGVPLVRTRCAGLPIRYAPALCDRIRRIHQAGIGGRGVAGRLVTLDGGAEARSGTS